jgi:hypothetical protein
LTWPAANKALSRERANPWGKSVNEATFAAMHSGRIIFLVVPLLLCLFAKLDIAKPNKAAVLHRNHVMCFIYIEN